MIPDISNVSRYPPFEAHFEIWKSWINKGEPQTRIWFSKGEIKADIAIPNLVLLWVRVHYVSGPAKVASLAFCVLNVAPHPTCQSVPQCRRRGFNYISWNHQLLLIRLYLTIVSMAPVYKDMQRRAHSRLLSWAWLYLEYIAGGQWAWAVSMWGGAL